MVIAICCTRNWYLYLATELYALFKHNTVKKLYLFIEDDKISFINDDRIEFININKLPECVFRDSPNYNTKYTKLCYLRCYFSKILKEDKVLYIDADAIVIDDISELWNIDLEDNVLAGVHESGEWDKHLNTYGLNDTYINSGVLLMDLKKIREEKLDDSMLYLLNHNWYAFPDQDVINLVCRNRIKYLSNIYNSTEVTGIVDNAKIVHYIRGNKGWINTSPRSEIWYNYHKEMIKEVKMENYKVRALKNFNDYEGRDVTAGGSFIERKAGKSEWLCSAERYLYLKENGAVELIEIQKVELPKKEPKIIETIDTSIGKVGYGAVEVKETKPNKKKTSKK